MLIADTDKKALVPEQRTLLFILLLFAIAILIDGLKVEFTIDAEPVIRETHWVTALTALIVYVPKAPILGNTIEFPVPDMVVPVKIPLLCKR